MDFARKSRRWNGFRRTCNLVRSASPYVWMTSWTSQRWCRSRELHRRTSRGLRCTSLVQTDVGSVLKGEDVGSRVPFGPTRWSETLLHPPSLPLDEGRGNVDPRRCRSLFLPPRSTEVDRQGWKRGTRHRRTRPFARHKKRFRAQRRLGFGTEDGAILPRGRCEQDGSKKPDESEPGRSLLCSEGRSGMGHRTSHGQARERARVEEMDRPGSCGHGTHGAGKSRTGDGRQSCPVPIGWSRSEPKEGRNQAHEAAHRIPQEDDRIERECCSFQFQD
eukprot:scaffold1501_cov352-Pavlova_lutheri.AAC.4